jgi:hypothetical protein
MDQCVDRLAVSKGDAGAAAAELRAAAAVGGAAIQLVLWLRLQIGLTSVLLCWALHDAAFSGGDNKPQLMSPRWGPWPEIVVRT